MDEYRPSLPGQIAMLMHRERASNREGIAAITTALIVALVTSDISKEKALQIFDECWDKLEQPVKESWVQYHRNAGHG
jgi:predicted small secreted protein